MAASMIVAEPEASLTPTKSSFEEELVHCGICHKLLQDPKTLSCLHSFCLKCLQKQLESTGKETTSLRCPTCNTETKLPPGGVGDLGVIAFVARQRNEKLIREKLADEDAKIKCTNCESSDESSADRATSAEAVTRCFECDDYLCESCTKMHKTFKLLKHHPLFTIDELKSGKVPLSLPDQNTCQKHKGEMLLFYCETCDVPICRQCVVIAHRHPEHQQVELDNVGIETKKTTILELERQSQQVATKIDELVALNSDLQQKLKTAGTQALGDIDKTKESLRSLFLENLDRAYKASTAKVRSIQDEKMSVLQNNLSALASSRSRLSTSRMIAREVTQKGTELEIAAAYAPLTSSLKELSETKQKQPSEELSKVKFEANKLALPEVLTLGIVCDFKKRFKGAVKIKI